MDLIRIIVVHGDSATIIMSFVYYFPSGDMRDIRDNNDTNNTNNTNNIQQAGSQAGNVNANGNEKVVHI